jgi:hypothetical protein
MIKFINEIYKQEIKEIKAIQNELRINTINMGIITFSFFPLLLINIFEFDFSYLFWIFCSGFIITFALQIETTILLNKVIKKYIKEVKNE